MSDWKKKQQNNVKCSGIKKSWRILDKTGYTYIESVRLLAELCSCWKVAIHNVNPTDVFPAASYVLLWWKSCSHQTYLDKYLYKSAAIPRTDFWSVGFQVMGPTNPSGQLSLSLTKR